MVTNRFGKGIAERFLIPYNEKLYACDLEELDADAMGRFFPYADLDAIIRNFREPDNLSYNATFTYPRGGAIAYVNALESEVKPGSIHLEEALVSVDLANKVATTNKRQIQFEYVITSAPFPALLGMTDLDVPAGLFRSNKVQVFNLGFDKKGPTDIHWTYFPEREYCFYRVGFYDNIFGTDKMSLYIEIGMPHDAPEEPDTWRDNVLADLQKAGIITDHKLLSHHAIMLNPAYVHITKESNAQVERFRQILAARGIYSIGRYGGWTYCAIEDNIVEARDLADVLNAIPIAQS
jgi:protoporphyrinogen oxidase